MTQQADVLNHLQQRPITPLEALDLYGCFRLAAVIYDLRNMGHDIVTDEVERNGKRFASYRLVDAQQKDMFG